MNKKIPFKPESVLYFGPFEVTSSSMRSPGCFPTVWKKVRGCRALVSICWLLCRHSADQLIPDPLNGCRWGGGGGPGHVTQSLSLVKLGLRNLEVCLGSTSCCPPIPPHTVTPPCVTGGTSHMETIRSPFLHLPKTRLEPKISTGLSTGLTSSL